MTKLVRKIRVNDFWNIVEHESWYTYMAQQGLFLKKKGAFFTYFEHGPSKAMKYRIEVSKKALAETQIDFYEAAGWDYVTSYNYFHVFRSPVEREAIEIHTDPVEQAHTLKDLNDRFTLSWLIMIVAAIFGGAMTWVIFFLDGTPIRMLVQGSSTSQFVLMLMMFLLLLQIVQASWAIRRLKNSLQNGIALQHDIPWKKGSWLRDIWPILYIGMATLGCILSFVQIFLMERGTVSEEDTRFSSVNLAAIEQNEQLTFEEDWYNGINYNHRYETDWNLFTKRQYTVDQSGIVPTMRWADSSGVYSPSIQTEFYDVRFEFLAQPLAKDLMEWYQYLEGDVYNDIEHASFDTLYTREEDSMIEIAATKGKKVVYVRYFGTAKLEDVVDQVAVFLWEDLGFQ